MATANSVRQSAAVKRENRANREREAYLALVNRQRQELAEFLDAFEFDDAPEPDDARSLVPVMVF